MANAILSRARYGEAFWQAHHEAWCRSELNHREYCELTGVHPRRSATGFEVQCRATATVCSLIATTKLKAVEPFVYLKDVLERMTEGHPMSRLVDLLPWNWDRSSAPT